MPRSARRRQVEHNRWKILLNLQCGKKESILEKDERKYQNADPILTCKAALVAVSNTSRTPSLLFAEHSRYAKALIFSAIARPSSGRTGSCLTLFKSLIVLGSFLRSWKRRRMQLSTVRPIIFILQQSGISARNFTFREDVRYWRLI